MLNVFCDKVFFTPSSILLGVLAGALGFTLSCPKLSPTRPTTFVSFLGTSSNET
jgi:hypothetical protein